jgi:hypothetical protein
MEQLAEPGRVCLTEQTAKLVSGFWALRRNEQALALARAVAHPFSLAFALNHAAWVRCLRNEWSLAEEGAERTIALSTERGFESRGPLSSW